MDGPETIGRRWREALDEWRIPAQILATATESPWTLPAPLFVGRARRQLVDPSGVSVDVASAALPDGGTVLDVGAGAGAASLAMRGRAGHITAVDEDAGMLATFGDLAAEHGIRVTAVEGQWPAVAASVPAADVVVCHHVLYNVADLGPFLVELTAHARRRVVVELTSNHPAAQLNPLWKAIHRVDRPDRPTAADAIALIAALDLEPQWWAWERPISQDGTSYQELVASTSRRLCLGPDRAADVDAALRDLGVRADKPYLGGPMRRVVTIWWAGSAADRHGV
jgi:SAM-dependent methyltransferase